MEKLLYVIWKKEAGTLDAFRDRLVGNLANQLLELGARKLEISVADEHVRFTQKARMSVIDPPISGMISFWLDTHLDRDPCEKVIAEATARSIGYLVLESQPIVDTTSNTRPRERTPGVNTVAFIEKPGHLDYEEWRRIWQESHTQVAIETQSTFLYTQNVVVRAFEKESPPWVAIVEEGFPRDAFVDPKIFYDACGSPERLEENRRRMVDSCRRFIEFDRLESHPFSQYVIDPAS